MDVIQAITLAIALLGAVLGVLGTWRTFSNDRVRVRVKPSYTMDTVGVERLAIEVLNLSTFPVTITHIGFTQIGTARHLQLIAPMLLEGGSLPKRLEPRTCLTAFAAPGATEDRAFDNVVAVYAKTACGLQIEDGIVELRAALHNLSLARRN